MPRHSVRRRTPGRVDDDERMNIGRTVDEVTGATPGVTWSVRIGDRAAHRPERRLRTASVGKLLLLVETARRIEDGRLDPAEPLAKDPDRAVADLTQLRDEISKLGETERLAIAGAYLARAQAAHGDLDAARAVADRAAADLIPLADPSTHLLVMQTQSEIAAARAEPGALAGLEYARSVARGWWKERQRALNAVQHALAGHDLSARHDAEWHAARQDPLTGVGNRRALDERMSVARDAGRSIAVIAIDVDNLKIINDSYGHACGDEVLRRVGHLLREQSRAEDVVARAGGDEFVVVLDNPDERGARELVERIKAAAERVAAAEVEPWFGMLRLSIGHATSTDGTPVSDLLSVADQRMYAEKRRRRQ